MAWRSVTFGQMMPGKKGQVGFSEQTPTPPHLRMEGTVAQVPDVFLEETSPPRARLGPAQSPELCLWPHLAQHH